MTDPQRPKDLDEETEPGQELDERRAVTREERVRTAEEELPYIDDRVSKVWVALIVAVFAGILLFGVLFGRAGMLTTTPSPTATPIPSPSPTATATTPPTPSPVSSPTPEVSPSPESSPSPAGSPSPTGSPSPAGSPTATPGST